ncbi:hypothetical protein CJP74_06035 [Psittacicella melopsittaci]|uniref:ABC transmembrane type-1 domain-containing protein n=1 Tax=Psittacicella melopsittaci TaxID=2028576 RepID=A0A3A1Y3T7_9GAMM|nr:ABC transporter permease subunit [Psittacicella melopsittaci]RIY31916.1 hypothetical protein CJP74_06035 [Psittacicella melopsittaci]
MEAINFTLLLIVLKGAVWTIIVSVLSMLLGMVLAIIFLGFQKAPWRIISAPFDVLLMMLRGLPEIVMVFLVYYGGSQLLSNFNINLDAFAAGIIALGLIFAAYASQTLRGAIESIPQGQWLSAKALGVNRVKIFFDIILPQMWRQAIPGLTNQWLSLLKDSSLVSIIGISEIIFTTSSVIKVTHQPFTWYIIAAILYLIISIVSNAIIKRLDRHFNAYLIPTK